MSLECIANLGYAVPLVPDVSRAVLVVSFRLQMAEKLSEEELDRESNRSLIIAFAGFSFTGVVALVVLEPTLQQTVRGAVFFLLVSFLTYLWALNLQGYKASRWQAEAATALSETGSLCLVSALISLLVSSQFSKSFVVTASLLAAAVWIIDHATRLIIDWRYAARRERVQKKGAARGQEESKKS
jgi:peptidoglycan/LPS O-acetylase OafA/YrhL